ncbi:MAG: hypothetical protein OJF51_002919 [Nitrospira sp.]|nr:MAG: hypothetical protein OJF51_002919 [Nitrospira sp.]
MALKREGRISPIPELKTGGLPTMSARRAVLPDFTDLFDTPDNRVIADGDVSHGRDSEMARAALH